MDSSHVVMISFPAQGHIKPMLMLAELLSRADIRVSFVNTEHSHRRIDEAAFRRRCPGINFLSIPDGLPPDHPRSGPSIWDLFSSIATVSKPHFKDMVASMGHAPSCIISDGIMSFAIDVAEELGIPAMTFRTYSATSTWLYFHLHHLIQDGHIPVLQGSEEMDKEISCIPGLEKIIRVEDLPSFCKLNPENHIVQFYVTQASKMRRASALILNTFEELESPFISHLRSVFPSVYAIGPLHTAINSTSAYPTQHTSSSLLQFDRSCMDWLDSQASKSVLYVSFGSVVVLTRDELMELWYGLVNSEKPFLWAIRPDLIWDDQGPSRVPEELKSGTTERGRIVGWAPQEDVLAHEAVGGFFTHSGWNSTLESIAVGKPMICKPMIAEQPVNSRCASEIWKVAIQMRGGLCERSTVEKLVRDLMEGRKVEIVESSAEFAKLAQNSVRDAGSSNHNLKKLIHHINLLHSTKNASINAQSLMK